MARALNVGGLMNVQYAIKDTKIYVLEVNPRASRTVPFVAKASASRSPKIALARHGGRKPRQLWPMGKARRRASSKHIAVKEAVFPFARFPGVDTRARPGNALDRRGHGPRHAISRVAFAKSQLGAGVDLPRSRARSSCPCATSRQGRVLPADPPAGRSGFKILATSRHGADASSSRKSPCDRKVNKVLEGRPHIVDAIRNRPGPARHQHDRQQQVRISDSTASTSAARRWCRRHSATTPPWPVRAPLSTPSRQCARDRLMLRRFSHTLADRSKHFAVWRGQNSPAHRKARMQPACRPPRADSFIPGTCLAENSDDRQRPSASRR
jgi:hypothetical protein